MLHENVVEVVALVPLVAGGVASLLSGGGILTTLAFAKHLSSLNVSSCTSLE